MLLWALMLAMILMLALPGYQAEAQNRIVGPSDTVHVFINDSDLDSNPKGVDRYDEPEFVVFRTNRDDIGEAHPDIVETGPNTGIFEFTIQLETDELACRLDLLVGPKFEAQGGSDPQVGVCPGDLVLAQYEDNRGSDGRPALIDYFFEVKSWDPEFKADREIFAPGERITINIYDPDANRDPDVADSLRDVRVYSQSDPAGQQASAIETGRNTGIFRLSFMTSLEPQGNSVMVKYGDELIVQYIDDFPADFTTFQEERKFSFVMMIPEFDFAGVQLTNPAITGTEESDEISAGQQLTLSSTVTSPSPAELAFVAIMEVRDSDGITVFIGWQSGTLHPESPGEIGMSWIPQDRGDYQVRTFIISDLIDPQVLSAVTLSEVTVAA